MPQQFRGKRSLLSWSPIDLLNVKDCAFRCATKFHLRSVCSSEKHRLVDHNGQCGIHNGRHKDNSVIWLGTIHKELDVVVCQRVFSNNDSILRHWVIAPECRTSGLVTIIYQCHTCTHTHVKTVIKQSTSNALLAVQVKTHNARNISKLGCA